MIPSLLFRALMLPRPDVVVTMTDPPMLAVLGPILRAIKGATLVHWAQDLLSEVAVEAGVLSKGGLLAGVLGALSTASLKAHDLVVPDRALHVRKALLAGNPRGEDDGDSQHRHGKGDCSAGSGGGWLQEPQRDPVRVPGGDVFRESGTSP